MTMRQETSENAGVTRAVVLAVFAVLVIFVVVLLIGMPIANLKDRGMSATYAIGIFIPPAAVCLLALRRSAGH